MGRKFNVPPFYRSPNISAVKRFRHAKDPRRKDLSPSMVDFGQVRFQIARHFGFCFGVENAIEIAYRAIEENPGKRIFLLSEMIHNPGVNSDLKGRGVRFLMDTDGSPLIPFSDLTAADIVIVPAFGTTIELQTSLRAIGIDPYFYDTTCPFVEKVWKRSDELGKGGFTVIVHEKRTHEETRATFSHSKATAPTLVILDIEDANFVVDYIKGSRTREQFIERFERSMSEQFDPDIHLTRVGVVNQTTMLATETQKIAETIRQGLLDVYGADELAKHYADTRDTLCYATYENQSATRALIEAGNDLAVVVGGYNSSNTSHLVELCEEAIPTFYIRNSDEIISADEINHFDLTTRLPVTSNGWLKLRPAADRDSKSPGPITIAVTSGASCPDSIVDAVIVKIAALFPGSKTPAAAFEDYLLSLEIPAEAPGSA